MILSEKTVLAPTSWQRQEELRDQLENLTKVVSKPDDEK
jgi:hypothetical protein